MLGESKAFSGFAVDDIEAARRGVAFEIYKGAPQDEKGVMREYGPADRVVPGPRRQHLVHHSAELSP